MNLPLDNIICGDCFDLIKTIPDKSINLIMTSPPYYQQRDYGGGMGNEDQLEHYLEKLLTLFEDCIRILREDGNIVFNLGDKYENSSLLLVPYRFAIQVTETYPVKLVNAITWVKSNPTPRQYKRRLVSSTEPFFHFVKSNDYYYNMDAFLQPDTISKKPKPSSKIGQGYYKLIEESDLAPEQKQHARQELLTVIQEVKLGKIESFRMKIRGIHSEPFGGQAGGRQIQLETNGFTIIRIHGNPLKKDALTMAVESIKGMKHPAVYPAKLIVEFLHLLTKENDIVLDPFIGSGSTAVACKMLNRRYIGFELNPDYCQQAQDRFS
ncbi:MAG: site-specific DNA-methyltransferase [Anaerolineae bacterium]|nr:site-specific DNA-methyltransferase [Anaerolineae bacterium]